MTSSLAPDCSSRTRRLSYSLLCGLSLLGISVAGILQPVAAVESASADKVSFKGDVRPILSNHCFACHGPDEAAREADMRLDIASDFDTESAIERITSDDPDMIMPPPSLNKPLDAEQIATLKSWFDAGAPYEQHWAFIAPSAVEPPAVTVAVEKLTALHSNSQGSPAIDARAWSSQSIDRFVLASLEKAGLSPSPAADRRTLVRRVTLDLTGLPPTPAEVEEFLADTSPEAYPRLVERLLNEPAYGEHMARYWLDLVRFADTNGLHHDHYREMTPYRDWVIRAFDENLPFDQFITDQLAGDLYPSPTTDQLIASGFNRLHLIIDRGTALPEESFFRNTVDQVAAVGTAFMGLTLQCAVCHDHKYDPITQRDFYAMSAFFNNFDGAPETGFRGTIDFKRGLQPPYIDLPSDEQAAELANLDAELASVEQRLAALVKRRKAAQAELAKFATAASDEDSPAALPANEPASQAVPQLAVEFTDKLVAIEKSLAEQTLSALDQAVTAMTAQRDAVNNDREILLLEIPATLVMKERAELRAAHIMIRGEYDKPGDEVERNTPGFLPPLVTDGEFPTRMDLAKWLTARDNPLTARVAVNRCWQQLFGVGLVKTSEDFGSQGESPRHPELLDYLALQFIDSGWDVKAMMRSMVLSATYRQTSRASRERYTADPRNRQLARGSRFRLDAEVVRDEVLAVSGLLNRTQFGKSVKPPQPAGLWETVAMPSSYPNSYTPDEGGKAFRRSLYTFWKRGLPPPQMTIFDAPTRESCTARRERTNTPLQALLLMNEEQYFAAARNWAESLLEQAHLTDAQRISRAYERITAHIPEPQTLDELRQGLDAFRELYRSDSAAVDAMLAANRLADNKASAEAESATTASATTTQANANTTADLSTKRSELAAWTMLVHSLLNLDITKTRE